VRTRPLSGAGWLLPLLLACACARDASEDASGGIPLPDLAHVDPDVVRAIEEERAALSKELDVATAWGRLGSRYMAHEFPHEAGECFRRAEELEPDEGVWAYRLGWSLFDEHPAQALVCFERARPRLADHAPLHESMATALVRLGRSGEARESLLRASELDPTSAHAETGLGQIALAAGDHEAARAHLEEALSRDPDHAEAHTTLAQVYLALGRTEEAERHAVRSRALPPTTPRKDRLASMSTTPAGFQARTRAALQLENRGRLEEAAEQFRIALDSNPSYTFARRRLAGILVRLERRDEAIALLREGLGLDANAPGLRKDLEELEGH
jgi:tetratricopeptide (TPR) repeat protein